MLLQDKTVHIPGPSHSADSYQKRVKNEQDTAQQRHMNTQKNSTGHVILFVETDALARFTTLLQGGFLLDIPQGQSIGDLLAALPGFTRDYIAQRVQTIFLDGLPADDLEQQLFGKEAVLAISAAMPGLAGAIFRKNGQHATLRTTTALARTESSAGNTPLRIRLKLFNMIAVEKGEQILRSGCTISAASLAKFLNYRPPLVNLIKKIKVNGQERTIQKLLPFLKQEETIELSIRGSHDS